MFGMFGKGRKKASVWLHLLICAVLLAALVYGYDLPRDDLTRYFVQLLGVVVFFILLALIPAALLGWLRRKRRPDPFDLTDRDGDR